MTLVLAVEDADGSVVLAADSAVSNAQQVDVLRSTKIRRLGAVGVAFAGSVAAFQIAFATPLRPRRRRGETPEEFLCRAIAHPIRDRLSQAGLLPRATVLGDDGPLTLVVAYAGQAFTIDTSFAVYATTRGYATGGVAEDIARGVLEHTAGQRARPRVHAAFAAACALSTGVRPPVVVEVVR